MGGQDIGLGPQAVGVVGAAELGVLAGRRPTLFDLGRDDRAGVDGPPLDLGRAEPSTAPAIGPLPGGGACPGSTAPAFSIAASADRNAETATASRDLRAAVSARRNVTVSTDAILPRLGRLR